MRFMNQMFVKLIQKNVLPKSTKLEKGKPSTNNFDKYLEGMMPNLLQKILAQFKSSLTHLTKSQDGLYCILFIKNAITTLIERQKKGEITQEEQQTLDLIWQEMHAITSKLT